MPSFGLYTKDIAYTLVVGTFLFNHSVVPKAYFRGYLGGHSVQHFRNPYVHIYVYTYVAR